MNYIDLFLRVISHSIKQTRWWSLLMKRSFNLSRRRQSEATKQSQKGLSEITSAIEAYGLNLNHR